MSVLVFEKNCYINIHLDRKNVEESLFWSVLCTVNHISIVPTFMVLSLCL